uniref:Uncharacterized protein n=1 Tax=Acrobeloides nanus TaxID=290746 RepID=A0A914DZG8_9BILA
MLQFSDVVNHIQDAIIEGESRQQIKVSLLGNTVDHWNKVDQGVIDNCYIDELLKQADNRISDIVTLLINEKQYVTLFEWIQKVDQIQNINELMKLLEIFWEKRNITISDNSSSESDSSSESETMEEIKKDKRNFKTENFLNKNGDSSSESDSELHELNYHPQSNVKLLGNYLRCLEECISSKLLGPTIEINLVKTAKTVFWTTFYESTNIEDPELELFRLLKVIVNEETLSKEFVCALGALYTLLDTEDKQKPCFEPEEDVVEFVSENQDKFIAKLARFLFGKECGTFEQFKLNEQFVHVMHEIFTTIQHRILSEGTMNILEISGRILRAEQIIGGIFPEYDNDSYDEVRILAHKKLFIDTDITLNGKNLSVYTQQAIIKEENTRIDLSGLEGDISAKPKPSLPTDKGIDGQDGADGKAGASSGHFALITEEIVNQEWLNIILNGARGQKGQDGGDGSDGNDGTDACIKSDSDIGSAGGSWFLGGLKVFAITTVKESFPKCSCPDAYHIRIDADYTATIHIFEYCSGSEGQKGGRGGRNGCGGEGGDAGKVNCYSAVTGQEFLLNVESRKGKDGKRGTPGRNGKDGADGCGSGYYNKSWGACKKFGLMDGKRVRLKLAGSDTNDEYRSVAKDFAIQGREYIFIEEAEEKRGQIREQEETREERDESTRQGRFIDSFEEQNSSEEDNEEKSDEEESGEEESKEEPLETE